MLQYKIVFPLLLFMALSGCRSGVQISDEWLKGSLSQRGSGFGVSEGRFMPKVASIDHKVKTGANGKDGVLLLLKQGSILRNAAFEATNLASEVIEPGLEGASPKKHFLKRSIEAWDQAEKRIHALEQAAKISLSEEGLAMLTNQATRKYDGRAYDKIMVHTYKALNYMELGQFDAARVELNRALQRQRDAVEQNAKIIEKAQAERERSTHNGLSGSNSYNLAQAQSDPKTARSLAEIEASVESRLLPYGDYVNPFSVFLDGLFFLYADEGNSDLERARKSFERVAGMVRHNRYIDEDLMAASGGELDRNVTYVIFETGSAPSRVEQRIDIPAYLLTDQISYIGASLPSLSFDDSFDRKLYVDAEGRRSVSALLSSMDSVIAQDFKNAWPAVVAATLLSTGTKAALDATLQNEAEKEFGKNGQLLTSIFTALLQTQLNRADTRTWDLLPKEFHYLRIPTPQDGILQVHTEGTSANLVVTPGKVNVVIVKSVSAGAPLLSTQFIF